jgi:MFS family permease
MSVIGIFMGWVSDRVNRSMLLGVSCIMWSAMTAISAISTHFWLLVITRIFLGVFESAGNPAAYSLIADFFPPEKRASAGSIYTLGIYIGGALSSLTIVFITGVGWRWAYAVIGYIGMGAGILCLFFVQEPVRGTYDIQRRNTAPVASSPLKKFLAVSLEIFTNPTCRWVVIAGSFRFFGGYAIGYYMPSFFGKLYPDYQTEYSILNAFVVSFGGFCSSYGGGVLSDIYEKKTYMSKAYVCIIGSLLGVPTIAICTLY